MIWWRLEPWVRGERQGIPIQKKWLLLAKIHPPRRVILYATSSPSPTHQRENNKSSIGKSETFKILPKETEDGWKLT